MDYECRKQAQKRHYYIGAGIFREKMKKASEKEPIITKRIATCDEIRAAYEALTQPELLRLFKYAKERSEMLGRKGRYAAEKFTGKEGEALVQRALIKTFDGDKKWYPDLVTFVAHMYQAVKNISGHDRKHLQSSKAEFEVQSTQEIVSEDQDPFANMASDQCNPEELLLEKEKNDYAEKFLQDFKEEIKSYKEHKLAADVLSGMSTDMKGSEIKEVLGLDQNQYETTQKYLFRTIEKLRERHK